MSIASPERISDGRRRLALATLATAGTAFAGLQSIIVPALPQLRESLNIDESASAWILTASLLATSVFTPLLGSLGDLYGRKQMLLVSVIAMVIGTVVSALAPSLPLMLVGRALQGVGGGIFPLAFAIVRDTFPVARVAGSIGLISSLLGLGGGLGLVVPGPIVDSLGYRWLFWFPAMLAILTVPGLLAWVPSDRYRRRGRVNIASAVLMGLGLIASLLGISEASNWGWVSPGTVGLLIGGLVILGVWAAHELRSTSPLIDLRTMAIHNVWISAAAAALIGFGMYSSFALFPAFAQTKVGEGGLGQSLTITGLLMLPTAVAQLAVGPLIGRLDRLLGAKGMLNIGGGLVAIAFAWIAISHAQISDLVTANALLGLGLGLGLPALANVVVVAVPPDQVGAATGINTIMRTIGGAIGGQVTLTMVATGNMQGSPSSGFVWAFVACASLGALAAVIAIALHGRSPKLSRKPAEPAETVRPSGLSRN
jgi:MFS family permease